MLEFDLALVQWRSTRSPDALHGQEKAETKAMIYELLAAN